ncbi:translation initiation factor eIF-2B [Marinobacter sp. F4216]|uniref:translation initiation factor eIF-2B n=1 Tax=Marinobacter sp. F4216 TaxID=2874281 RepID=UPI001CC14384|nr:initiation factor 2B [Marinobacter sp. F4216]
MNRPRHYPNELIDTLRSDQTSGASQLAMKGLEGLRRWLERNNVSARELETALDDLQNARPSMVPMANAITRCRSRFGHWPDAGNVSAHAASVVTRVLSELAEATEQVARHGADLVPAEATVLTHSRSSQVLALFRHLVACQRPFSVICTQSSPGNEGFTLTKELDQLGVEVTLITDAQLGLFVPEASLAVVGCDTWLADHHFVNKSGTYLLTLLARDVGIPCWVLADTFKDSPDTRESITLEELSPDEIRGPKGEHIRVRNVYFETVPERLITGRVSEQGVSWFPAGLAR